MSEEVRIPVTVAGHPTHIAGTLTVPDGARTIQLLVHGFTYDRRYWDFPHEPEKYSYVHRAAQAGYATLAIDRVGSGASGRPPGRRLTWGSAADTVGQVITAIRRGDLGQAFDQVILVGHSYGSVTAYRVANTHPGVDAMIATGITHRVSIVGMTRHLVLRTRPLKPGPPLNGADRMYVTTAPGMRRAAFNHTSADPALIALDEAIKQPAGAVELPTALVYLLPGVSRHTRIPALTVVGSEDLIFPGRWNRGSDADRVLADFERRFYAPGATVEAAVIAGAGHCLTLEPQAQHAYDRMLEFCGRHCGPS